MERMSLILIGGAFEAALAVLAGFGFAFLLAKAPRSQVKYVAMRLVVLIGVGYALSNIGNSYLVGESASRHSVPWLLPCWFAIAFATTVFRFRVICRRAS